MIDQQNFAYGRSAYFRYVDVQGLFKKLNELGFSLHWYEADRSFVCFDYTPTGGAYLFIGNAASQRLMDELKADPRYGSKVAGMLAPHVERGDVITIREIGRIGDQLYGCSLTIHSNGEHSIASL